MTGRELPQTVFGATFSAGDFEVPGGGGKEEGVKITPRSLVVSITKSERARFYNSIPIRV